MSPYNKEHCNLATVLCFMTSIAETMEAGGCNPPGSECGIETVSGDQEVEYSCDNNEKYKCKLCNKAFTTKSNLKRHIRRHTGEKPFTCPDCGCKFSLKDTLLSHQRRHSGERPYICDTCQKTFRSRPNLLSHRKLHTDERPYNCGECGKTFLHNFHLRVHKRQHSSETPFACDICDKKFYEVVDLQRHNELFKESYSCHLCDKKLCGAESLELHLKAHGVKNYACKDCGRTFQRKNSLSRHLRQGDYTCKGNCRYRSKFKEKGYECDVCHRKFATKSLIRTHINKHLGKKPFECPDCGNRFTVRSSLKQHLKLNCKGKSTSLEASSHERNEARPSVGPVKPRPSLSKAESSCRASENSERIPAAETDLKHDLLNTMSLPEVSVLVSSPNSSPPVDKVEKLAKELSLNTDMSVKSTCSFIGSYELNIQNVKELDKTENVPVGFMGNSEEAVLSVGLVNSCFGLGELLDIKDEIEIVEEDIE